MTSMTRVGYRYALLRLIGRGATGDVWNAWDHELGRHVALKLFPIVSARDASAVAVIREAQASSRIASDYVIRIHNTLIDERLRVAAIDMELCREVGPDGIDMPGYELSKAVRPGGAKKAADVRQAVRWVYEAALGVHEAHRQSVFHRDLKPANILVRPLTKRAQVLDFGLAARNIINRSAAHPGLSVARQTMTMETATNAGQKLVAGTPGYMAPEQAKGLDRLDVCNPLDRKTLVKIDVYGLGAVLFELLSGQAPHDVPTPNVLAILQRAAKNEIPFARLASCAVSGALLRCLKRALATNPDDRYASAQEFAQDLNAILINRPTLDQKRRPLVRGLLAARRNPQLLSSLAALLVLANVVTFSFFSLRDANGRIVTVQKNVAALTTQKKNLDRDIAALEADKNEATRLLDETQNQLTQKSKDLKLAQDDYTAKEKQLSTDLTTAQKATKVAEDDAKKAENTSQGLALELVAKRKKVEELETEVRLLRAKIGELNREVASLNDDITRLKAQHRTALSQKDTEIDGLKKRVTVLETTETAYEALKREHAKCPASAAPVPPDQGAAPASHTSTSPKDEPAADDDST